MKIILALVSLIGTATIISSLPLVEDSIYKELAQLDATNDGGSPSHKEREKTTNLVRFPLPSGKFIKKQDVNNLYQELIEVGSKFLNSVGDYIYNHYDKKYGIDDELHKVVQGIADIFHSAAGFTKVDSSIIDFKVKEGITKGSFILERIFSYLYGRVIKEKKFDVSDCKQADATVDAPDGWAPLFQVLKFYQQNFTCLFFKKAERDNSLTIAELNMFKNFFDLVIKLYETEHLVADVDKLNLRKSLDYFMEAVHKLNLSRTYKNDVKTLINVFFKVLTGEQLTFIDKALALKSFFTLYIAQFKGISVFRTLLFHRHTSVFMTSLSPIAMKVGLREYVNSLKQRKHINLSSNTRMILNQLLPMLKNLINSILQNLSKFVGMQPKYFSGMQLRRKVGTKQKLHENNNRRVSISQHTPDFVTAAVILQLMITNENENKGKGFKFMEDREAKQATVEVY